ncbi:TPA: hypothetical protein LA460_000265 [Clostridium botulinum]|nr:hypothetical protein [Clostridium botulinum]HBJ1652869.1 hypothetical protein [Clostridium botulinum]
MKYTINFLGQIILALGLANVAILLVPRFIRKIIKKTMRVTYKVVRITINLVIKQVKTLYVAENKTKKKATKHTKKAKQPSNVIYLKDKVVSK